MMEEPPIVTNPDILGEMFVPPDIPGREAQIRELVACVNGKLNSYGYGKQNSHGHGKQKSHKDGNE